MKELVTRLLDNSLKAANKIGFPVGEGTLDLNLTFTLVSDDLKTMHKVYTQFLIAQYNDGTWGCDDAWITEEKWDITNESKLTFKNSIELDR